ncbi:hypothetical protein BDD43_0809 [Mucilaginibacter gracilis]|uniref:Uncharacterized protein n=1 Tax=Mucilaginibacter gracilis TaxID=423350 RepID=A0A495IV92_9SPHI|nr:hypothetical protein [Mucilaginibacter gracilis]RKR80677.1 hypothetical protein BDD43_0809 [Mucilaginibacter gracilis]
MEIEPAEIPQMIAELKEARAKGHRWVAFNERESQTPDWLRFHFFDSSADAEQYCYGRNFPDDLIDSPGLDHGVERPDEIPADYRFMAIDSLQAALQPEALTNINTEFDLVKSVGQLADQMKKQSVRLIPGSQYEGWRDTLQNELVFPVEWIKTIMPEQEIAQYHVVQHEHPGHQVYEIGHRHRVMESFNSFEQARDYMEHAVNLSSAMNERYDYLLIGQYKNKPLKQGLEGDLPANCGLTLLTANYQYSNDPKIMEYRWHHIHSPGDPAQIHQYMFAKFNRAEDKLDLYNVRLQKASPEDYTVSIFPSHFINYPITLKNSLIMNEQNLNYLKESLKYAGFDTKLNDELEKNINSKAPAFQLNHSTKIGEDDMVYALQFRKGEKDEMYFFNRMDATLKKPGENEKGITQTFYQNQHISAKEAYNLLDGRAVHTNLSYKDDIKKTYPAWVQLDFSQKDKNNNYEVEKFTENYGFKIEDSLKELSLKERDDTQATERMLKSLKRGNLTEANWENNGTSEKIYLSANPKEWKLNAYDEAMNKLDIKDLKLNAKAKSEDVTDDISDSTKKNKRQEQKNDQTPKPSKKVKL